MPSLGRLGYCVLGARSGLYEAECRQSAICVELNRVENSPRGLETARVQSDLKKKLAEATESVAEEFSRVWGPCLAARGADYCFRSEGSDCVAVIAFGNADGVRKELEFPLGVLDSVGNAESYKGLHSSFEEAELAEFSRGQLDIYERYFSGSGSIFYSVAPGREAVFALGDKKVMDRLKTDLLDPDAVDADSKTEVEQMVQEFLAGESAAHERSALGKGSRQQ